MKDGLEDRGCFSRPKSGVAFALSQISMMSCLRSGRGQVRTAQIAILGVLGGTWTQVLVRIFQNTLLCVQAQKMLDTQTRSSFRDAEDTIFLWIKSSFLRTMDWEDGKGAAFLSVCASSVIT